MTHNQIAALQRLASNGFSARIPARILNSLLRRGLIEKESWDYHRITEEGAAVVYEYENRKDKER